MADLRLADFVKESSTTTGTGTYSLAGAVSGHQGFVAAGCAGSQVPYVVTDGTNYEIGLGTVTDSATDTLSRDAIYASSNAGSAVNWSAGTRDVYLAQISGDMRGVRTITGTTTLGYGYEVVLCNSSSAFTITLPAAASYPGKEYVITNINTGKVTIDGNSTETIKDPTFGSATTIDLWVIYDSVTIISDGSAWWVTAKNFASHQAEVALAAATSFTSVAEVQVNFDTIVKAKGASADLAETAEILCNRGGEYMVYAHASFSMTDGTAIRLAVYDNAGTPVIKSFDRYFASASLLGSARLADVITLTAGTRYGLKIIQSGTTQNSQTDATTRPTLGIKEML